MNHLGLSRTIRSLLNELSNFQINPEDAGSLSSNRSLSVQMHRSQLIVLSQTDCLAAATEETITARGKTPV